jgi:hypothetical protein
LSVAGSWRLTNHACSKSLQRFVNAVAAIQQSAHRRRTGQSFAGRPHHRLEPAHLPSRAYQHNVGERNLVGYRMTDRVFPSRYVATSVGGFRSSHFDDFQYVVVQLASNAMDQPSWWPKR